ncbi:putative F-box/kelch-repeat protein At3g24610 [Eutrema salsugineum]|uniref:putative F-box/kelch-repeat protein At3g24610 n=1 Tax=Eutrema salsugineum TaxID=72664 RepID=UPI000CED082A|nr:putative F-box/kelch-repeat protein At3g24610 [Eutrema salsugineum]
MSNSAAEESPHKKRKTCPAPSQCGPQGGKDLCSGCCGRKLVLLADCVGVSKLSWSALNLSEERMDWKWVKGLGSLVESLSSSRLVHFDRRNEGMWKFSCRKSPSGVYKKLADLLPGARLCKFSSNLVIFWDVIEGDRFEIWCAEISLERRQGAEIWGYIEWSHPVMTVEPFLHRRYKVLHSVSVTL